MRRDLSMPVSPEKQRLYPGGSLLSPEWRAIRRRILKRTRHRCESCGVGNYKPNPVTGSMVVLTIAHLDQDPTNNSAQNLRALCQLCHNRHDAPMRALHAAETRRRKMNNLELFGESDQGHAADTGRQALALRCQEGERRAV